MKEQNEKNIDKKATEVREKLTDETLDKVAGGKPRYLHDKDLCKKDSK